MPFPIPLIRVIVALGFAWMGAALAQDLPVTRSSGADTRAATAQAEAGRAAGRPQQALVSVPGPLPDLQDDGCSKNRLLKTAGKTTEVERRRSAEAHSFFNSAPAELVRGITSVQIDGTTLLITGQAKDRFEEFSGPVVDVIEKIRYEARPGTAVLAHTLTLGLGLIFAPVDSAQHALGCTDRRVIAREVVGQDSRPTGRSRWVDSEANLVVRVEGLGQAREWNLLVDATSASSRLQIDFLPSVMQARSDGPVPIQITCLNCNSAQAQASGEALHWRDQVSLLADFSKQREAELSRLERQAEQERRALFRREQELLAVEQFKKTLLGRWSDRAACMRTTQQELGTFYEAGAGERVSVRVRQVILQQGQPLTQYVSEDVQFKVVDLPQGIFELDARLRLLASGRSIQRKARIMIAQEEMVLLDQTETVTGSGRSLPAGRPNLVNCDHPKMVAARAEIERQEAEQVRLALLAEQERRVKLEREQAELARLAQIAAQERRRQAEREEVERQRLQAERQREEAQRRRRQEERERLYKL